MKGPNGSPIRRKRPKPRRQMVPIPQEVAALERELRLARAEIEALKHARAVALKLGVWGGQAAMRTATGEGA